MYEEGKATLRKRDSREVRGKSVEGRGKTTVKGGKALEGSEWVMERGRKGEGA